MNSRARIVLADDHSLVAAGLRRLLEPEFQLVATVGDGRALLDAVEEHRPEIVITDISMPSLNGLEAMRKLKKADPGTRVIFLTMHADVNFATEAIRLGASGYLLKRSAAEELTIAVREVLAGRAYITPMIAKDVLASLMEGQNRREVDVKLTSRQREVLQLVGEGKSIKKIAAILGISPKTVEFHKYKISEKLGLRGTAELTQYAIRHGLIGP